MLSFFGQPQGICFFDDFSREMPGYSDLGMPPLGGAYYLAGPDLAGHSPSDSVIRNGRWCTELDQVTYLNQKINGSVVNIGGKFKWVYVGNNGGDGVMIFLICQMPDENLAYNCLHIRATRFGLAFDMRYHGDTPYSRSVQFDSPLNVNTDYTFDFDYKPELGLIEYNIYGETAGIVASPFFIDRGGPNAAFEHFYNPGSSTKLSVGSIWAGKK